MFARTATIGYVSDNGHQTPVAAGFESRPCTYPGGFSHSTEPAHLFLIALHSPTTAGPALDRNFRPHSPPPAAEDEHAE
jgi:hypothetical protein